MDSRPPAPSEHTPSLLAQAEAKPLKDEIGAGQAGFVALLRTDQ